MKQPETKIISKRELSLKEMQDIVGGNIELAYDDGKIQIICNEEGKMFDLPLNMVATKIWHDKLSKFNSNPNYVPQDYLVGPVLILKDKALMT
tara:strand:+ start:246 stop:524 length:279 start_codon:yes stop_codon:yes gene_type:complete